MINEQDFRIGARSLGFRRAKTRGAIRYDRVSYLGDRFTQTEMRLSYFPTAIQVQVNGGTVHVCRTLEETWRSLCWALLEDD